MTAVKSGVGLVAQRRDGELQPLRVMGVGIGSR